MQKLYMSFNQKEKYCTDIFKLRIYDFMIMWFIEFGEWFIYIHFGRYWVRFSSAGFLKGIDEKKFYKRWLKDYHEFK